HTQPQYLLSFQHTTPTLHTYPLSLHDALPIFKRQGRPNVTRELHLPGRITTLPREYGEQDLARFFTACSERERVLFSTFLMTGLDRKSTRLNSSHGSISYAVFCLKKKKYSKID